MSKLDRWIDNKIVQNLFVWFLLFLILLTTIQAENRVESALFGVLLLAPGVYVNNLLILPFLKRNRFFFALLFLINAIVFTAISVFFIKNALSEMFRWEMFFNFFGIMILALVFATAIKMARDSFTRRQNEKEAELKLLKAQLNPHFLFNTLNNLYGLSVTKSDKLPSLMLKLSDLLRYSLYETKEAFVPLEKEIQYLENYMSLEKIRLEDQTDFHFTRTGPMSSKMIAPMLFIVFVENAFKHLGEVSGHKSTVSVSIDINENSLLFCCINTIDKLHDMEIDLEKGKSGIGLENAKKRLAIMYPDKHQLAIHSTDAEYKIKLELELNN